MANSNSISVRLTKQAAENLQKMVAARGLSKSVIINKILVGTPIIDMGDIGDLAKSYCELRDAINNSNEIECKKEGARACQSLSDLLIKMQQMNVLEID